MHRGRAFALGGLLEVTPDGASSADPHELDASGTREQADRQAAARTENNREVGLPGAPKLLRCVLESDCVMDFSSGRRFSGDPNVNSTV